MATGLITGRLVPEVHCEISEEFRSELAVQLADKSRVGPAKTWIQVAKSGTYKGHSAGEFHFGPDEYAEIVRNFSTQKSKPPLDFEHASESMDGGVYQHGAPANGWITDLRYNDDRMEAQVEWVEASEGFKYVKDGQYRYISPAVQFSARDRVSGKRIGAMLTSVALTNRPFLDGMDKVTAKHMMGAVASKKHPPVEGEWDAAAAKKRLAKWASSDDSGDKDKIDWKKYALGFAYVIQPE